MLNVYDIKHKKLTEKDCWGGEGSEKQADPEGKLDFYSGTEKNQMKMLEICLKLVGCKSKKGLSSSSSCYFEGERGAAAMVGGDGGVRGVLRYRRLQARRWLPGMESFGRSTARPQSPHEFREEGVGVLKVRCRERGRGRVVKECRMFYSIVF